MNPSYSEALLVDGPLIFISGQLPTTPDGSLADGDAVEQTRQVFRNLDSALGEYAANLRHLAKLTYYLRHIADLEDVRRVFDEFLHHPRPASTLVEVSGLVDSRYLVEIDAVACLPRGDSATWAT